MVSSSNDQRIAVIDVETTGLFPNRHDRVIEIAAVIVRPGTGIEREWVTLVNPGRDIGPTAVHGLYSEDILQAPTFADVAHRLLEVMSGSVAIAGHNVWFDRQFVRSELDRLGHALPECEAFCTMHLSGGGELKQCCESYDLVFDGQAHSALYDAKMTALLLLQLFDDNPDLARKLTGLNPVNWPTPPTSTKPLLTRNESRKRQFEPPEFLQRLLHRAQNERLPRASDGATIAYAAMLDRVLEDRRIDDSEAHALIEMATTWGITGEQIGNIHQSYLNQLAIAALADGVVTDSEKQDLKSVAKLLGLSQTALDSTLSEASVKFSQIQGQTPKQTDLPVAGNELAGLSVCFTGELLCTYQGKEITREEAFKLAEQVGLIASPSVTKKLHLLVVADPHTQSGKAKKARDYGVRIMQERVFWKAIGLAVD